MSRPLPQFASLRVFKHFLPQVSRIAIAAVLFGCAVALPSAEAFENDIRANDTGLFNVPGEGLPYTDRLAPRVWPPMPERRSVYFSHVAQDEEPGYLHGAPYQRHDDAPPHDYERPDHEERHEDHAGPADYDHDRRPSHDHARRYEPEPEPDHGQAPPQEDASEEAYQGRGFGRMFPSADQGPDHAYGKASYQALQRLGRSMVEEGSPDDPAGDSEMPAGYTYLGQFIDHDLTLDTTSDLGHEIHGDYELENARTPELDLDSVYGGGSARTPHLYNLPYIRVGRPISPDGYLPRYDLFRTKSSHYYGPSGGEAAALLGDPRNDENIIISQLHAAFVAFHNRTVDILVERDYGQQRHEYCHEGPHCSTQELAQALPDDVKQKIFETAKDHVIYYYHRLILDDFLPRVIGPQHTANLLRHGRDFFFPHGFRDENGRLLDVYIPVEFAVAAFRYGHSQVRDSYTLRDGARVNLLSDGGNRGPHAFEPVTPHYLIDWSYFFDIATERPYGFNLARRIDPELARSLHHLAFSKVVGMHEVTSLAARNLARGKTLHLPSGQQVASLVLPRLEPRGLLGRGEHGHGGEQHDDYWRAYLLPPDDRTRHFLGDAETPLWYYILQEASIFGAPTHLYAVPQDRGGYVGADSGHQLLHRVSADHRYGPYRRGGDYDGPDGGNRLGPVGATIVGEVLTGLVEYYREKTGKGIGYHPEIQGSLSHFNGVDGGDGSGHRYLMRNFLIDAGVVEE